MLAIRLSRFPVTMLLGGIREAVPPKASRIPCSMCGKRGFGEQVRSNTLRRVKERTSIKDSFMAPATDTAFNLGKGLVAGASVIGIGALCFYGLGFSNEAGTIDKAALWSEVVRQRVRDTYLYFGGSLVCTAASALAIARNPRLMALLTRNTWMSLLGTMVAVIGSGIICQSIPYQPGFGAKQIAWLVHSSILGAIIAPLTLLGGPLMIRAACYTAGIVGGLSMVAICAPSDKFLNMGGPLAMGLGVVFVSSIGTWFLPPTSALGAGMWSIAVYGGLVLFGMFLLYDTQKIIKRAETYPLLAARPFDPINSSIGIYLDTINIFIRIATILAGGGNRKR